MIKGPPPKFHGTRDNLRMVGEEDYRQRVAEPVREFVIPAAV
jgi:hypothetical protein